MSESVLKIDDLTKYYGHIKAIDQLNLQVEKGNVYGILGPNGSGKTTTLGILLGILYADKGSYDWFENGQNDENRLRIGALLETPNFYPYLSARQNLKITAHIKKIKNIDEKINAVLDMVFLSDRANDYFKTYSLGMKQRLAIASALLNDPEVLVLDEPTNGLDPQGIADVRNLISEISKKGKTIIIASHILDEIEKICSHVAIIKNGQLLNAGPLSQILQSKENIIVNSDNLEKTKAVLESINWVKINESNSSGIKITLDEGKKSAELNKIMFDKGITLSEISIEKNKLESTFLEITKE